MNKSKFLKKSLAMLLALMLVLAMIPLSASAETSAVPTIGVGNAIAKPDGTTYTVEAGSTDVVLGGNAPAGSPEGTKVVFIDKDGKDLDLSTNAEVDLTEVATVSDNTYTLGVELRVPQEGSAAPAVTKYTLVITYNEAVKGTSTAIKYLKDIAGMAEYEIGADKITIVAEFGKPIAANSLVGTNFVAADPNATVTYSNSSVKVVSDDRQITKNYEVVIDIRDGLTSFEVEGQIGETEIDTNPADSVTTVELTVPYDTDLTKLVPTFEFGPDAEALTTYGDNQELTSGETEHDFTATNGKQLILWTDADALEAGSPYPTGSWYVVNVTINVADNTNGVLESIQVKSTNGNSNVIEVAAPGTVNVEMPKGYDFSAATSVTVELTGSKEAKVEVLGQPGASVGNGGEFDTDGEVTISGVDISSKSFIIRVSSQETGAEYNEYTINLSAAAKAGVELTNIIVKGDVDGDNVPETYEMGEDYTVTLPYTAKAIVSKLAPNDNDPDLRIYFAASTGATVGCGGPDNTLAVPDGASLTYIFNPGVDSVKKNNERDVTVSNAGNKETYTIKLAYEDGLTGHVLNSATLVGENDVAKITTDNTYNTVPGTAKDKNGNTVNTLRVNVPSEYSFTSDTSVYTSALGLSEGAVAFVVADGQVTEKLSVLDGKAKGVQDVTTIPVKTNLVDSKGVLDTDAATTIIYVVSEQVYVDGQVANNDFYKADLQKLVADKKAAAYYVYGVHAAPKTGADLVSIESTLDEYIDVTMKANNVIEIAVPYSYEKANSNKDVFFTLNFRADAMATVRANNESSGYLLESDLGNPDNAEDATQFNVANGKKLYADGTTGGQVNSIIVTSEDYVANVSGKKNEYTIEIKVKEAETGDDLLSVGASGATATPDTNRDVNLTLPYGSTKYPVKLDIEASKLATVYVGTSSKIDELKVDANLYDPEKGYDLNSDLKILVVAENNHAQQVYTLKTTVAENFFDVAKDQWYYDEVLKAASNGWINGTKPGYYEPNGTMTRGDFALIIARIKNYNPALYTDSGFPDVESTDYYSAAIAYCKEMGYLGGENGYFNPKDPITREEMAKIICNAAGVDQVTDPTSPYADDDTIAEWAKGYVYGCQAAEIMMGDESANTFDARSNATRAEAAAVLVRAFA